MLQFQNVSKSFSGVEVLHQVSFSLEPGKIVALVGENGAGKTTLMKILSGILTEFEGRLLLHDQPIRPRTPRDAEKKGIAIIHQELNLVPDLTVGENIFLGREPVSWPGRINFQKLFRDADRLLKEFDFPFSSRVKVRSLPVGWQQMVEIARAFQVNANLLVMDEPTSALSEHEIELLFRKMNFLRELGKTIIFISHRLREVFEVADQIVILRDGSFVGKYERNDLNRDQLISLMIGHELTSSRQQSLKEQTVPDVLQVNDVKVYDRSKICLENLKFSLKQG